MRRRGYADPAGTLKNLRTWRIRKSMIFSGEPVVLGVHQPSVPIEFKEER